jgi:NADP-dependent 3-hydroxy acid dehydrogenase YdfG
MVADISKLDNVRSLVAAVQRKFGAIHFLINNAGIGRFASVAELKPEQWDEMIGLNLSGVNYCCHEVLPIFKQSGGGDIVNIGSLAGVNAFAGGAGYNASKFGLVGFSEAMMLDHRFDGVRVSLVMPGSVDTAFGGGDADQAYEKREKSSWKIRPEDLAEIVVNVLRMPGRVTISRIEVRPSRPPRKT